jgi:hypothetical protein
LKDLEVAGEGGGIQERQTLSLSCPPLVGPSVKGFTVVHGHHGLSIIQLPYKKDQELNGLFKFTLLLSDRSGNWI